MKLIIDMPKGKEDLAKALVKKIKKDFGKGKPEDGKIYSLTSANGPSIASGNTWAESEIKEEV